MCAEHAKFTISMPESLLSEIDAEAESSGTTRSGVIREAAAVYLEQKREANAAAARRAGVNDAAAIMREISEGHHGDPRPTIEILREVRDIGDADQRAHEKGER